MPRSRKGLLHKMLSNPHFGDMKFGGRWQRTSQHRDGTLIQAVCSRLGAQVYRVYPDGGQVAEEKLAMTFLSPAPCD